MQDRVTPTSVSLALVLFRQRAVYIFQGKVTALQKNYQKQKKKKNLHYLPFSSRAVPTPTCPDLFKTITARMYLWSVSFYTAVYKVLRGHKTVHNDSCGLGLSPRLSFLGELWRGVAFLPLTHVHK